MPDYGRPLEFGISLAPTAVSYAEIVAASQEADRLGLDLLGIQDHPYQYRFLDTMALLATLAAATDRIRVFPDVACLPLREPAMLGKESASIDVMSGGRFELGLGAGAFWDAIEAMGGPRRSPGEALDALDEAVAVIRHLWSGDRNAVFRGQHYHLGGLNTGPTPAHQIEIWFGVGGPRALGLLGRVADGWIPSLGRDSLEDLDAKHAIIDEAAQAAQREPAAIRRLANAPGTITSGPSEGFLDGPADQWVEQLTGLAVDHGFDSFIFWPVGDPAEQIPRFAGVVPDVRASVQKARR